MTVFKAPSTLVCRLPQGTPVAAVPSAPAAVHRTSTAGTKRAGAHGWSRAKRQRAAWRHRQGLPCTAGSRRKWCSLRRGVGMPLLRCLWPAPTYLDGRGQVVRLKRLVTALKHGPHLVVLRYGQWCAVAMQAAQMLRNLQEGRRVERGEGSADCLGAHGSQQLPSLSAAKNTHLTQKRHDIIQYQSWTG
jgi:hypothetical protein